MTLPHIGATSSDVSRATILYAKFWIFQIMVDNANYFDRLCQNNARKFIYKLHQKSNFEGPNYANIRLKIMSEKSLWQI